MKKKGRRYLQDGIRMLSYIFGSCALWIEVSGKKPSDEQLMTVIALLMIIIGLVYAAFSLSRDYRFSFPG